MTTSYYSPDIAGKFTQNKSGMEGSDFSSNRHLLNFFVLLQKYEYENEHKPKLAISLPCKSLMSQSSFRDIKTSVT